MPIAAIVILVVGLLFALASILILKERIGTYWAQQIPPVSNEVPPNVRQTMRRAGNVLLVVAAVDAARFVLAVYEGRSYSSSLVIFGPLLAVALYRGGLGAVRTVATGAAFLGLILVVATLVSLFTMPMQLAWLILTKDFLNVVLPEAMSTVILLVVLVWLYISLTRIWNEFGETPTDAGIRGWLRHPRAGFVYAAPFALLICFIPIWGAGAKREGEQLARAEFPQYTHFWFDSWASNCVNGRCDRRVYGYGYNEKDYLAITVQWSD